jgi:hypothetical protein
LLPQFGVLELLVTTAVNGAHPWLLFNVNEAVGIGLTQIVLVVESAPQTVFPPVFNFTVYNPGVEKLNPIEVVPCAQSAGSIELKSFPMAPDVKVHPAAGVIFQTDLPAEHTPCELTLFPLAPELLTVTGVDIQTVSFGEMDIAACDFKDT